MLWYGLKIQTRFRCVYGEVKARFRRRSLTRFKASQKTPLKVKIGEPRCRRLDPVSIGYDNRRELL